jgi:hypothetical protein
LKATVISVRFDVNEEKNGKTYSFFKLQYLTDKKENKTYSGMMSALKFNKVLNTKLNAVKENDEVELTFGKNKFGYDELQNVELLNKPAPTKAESKPASSGYNNRDFETKEERQQKQVYIVRQSSISAAISLLKTEKKVPTIFEILDTARQFEQFVFGGKVDGGIGNVDAALVDDLPFDVHDIPQ